MFILLLTEGGGTGALNIFFSICEFTCYLIVFGRFYEDIQGTWKFHVTYIFTWLKNSHPSSFMSRKLKKVKILKKSSSKCEEEIWQTLMCFKKDDFPNFQSINWILEVIFRLWDFKRTNSREFTTLRKWFGIKRKFTIFYSKKQQIFS